jgi:RNA polymerase sigma-70 factor (ECF subfamily)
MANVKKSEYEIMYDTYKPLVMKAVRTLIKCEATIEDVTQDVFEKVYKHFKTFDVTKAQFGTWIVTIAHNTAIDYLRKEGLASTRFVSVDNFVKDGKGSNDTSNFFIEPSTSDQDVDRQELKGKITRAFASLKGKQREIAILYFKQKLQYTDIANVLEIPLNTVKVTIMRVREALQTQLKAEYQLIN